MEKPLIILCCIVSFVVQLNAGVPTAADKSIKIHITVSANGSQPAGNVSLVGNMFNFVFNIEKGCCPDSDSNTTTVSPTTASATSSTTTKTTATSPITITSGPPASLATYLLVAGGFNGSLLKSVEWQAMSDNQTLPTCIKNLLESLPHPMQGAIAFLKEGKPTLCGGNYGSVYLDSCLIFKAGANSWEDTEPNLRLPGGPMVFAGHASSPDGSVWAAAGGFNGSHYLNTGVWWNRTAMRPLPNVPTSVNYPCLAIFGDQNKLLFTGGYNTTNRKEAFLFKHSTSTWTRVADMKTPRYGHACGATGATNNNVVVTGGRGDWTLTVEVYSSAEDKWTYAEPLPHYITYASTITLSDGFLVVGGYSGPNAYLDTVYKFVPASNTFAKLNVTLSSARRHAMAYLVTAQC